MDDKRFNEMLEGVQQAVEHHQGKRKLRMATGDINEVKAVRLSLELSQEEFAATYSIPLRTLQNWESGGRKPDATVQAYLKAIKNAPDAIRDALAA